MTDSPHLDTRGAPTDSPHPDMLWIPGGEFLMGSDKHYKEEAPAHKVAVNGFWMDRAPVTNAEYSAFVTATNYVTLAEKVPNAEDYPGALPEMLVAASSVFIKPTRPVDMQNAYNWWHWVPGADWRHPQGPGSSLNGKDQHPVVQLALQDVEAYLAWVGKELPTEAEWEFAARGGLEGAEYAWGNEFMPGGKYMANTWQGHFPYQNTRDDGFEGTSPIGSFPPNGYGLLDITGNVWEWTRDWYANAHLVKRTCCTVDNPRGATAEQSIDPLTPQVKIPRRVIKGGSHLCAPNYCLRYRPAARMAQAEDTGTSHLGFRGIVRA